MGCLSFRIGDWNIALAEDSKPHELMIELTTECNLNCLHCFRNSMREPFGSMTKETMVRILSEIEKNGVKAVSLSGWGEPLYHPDALWFIEELKKRDVRVLLNTNGILLLDNIEKLVRLGVDVIIVSLDATEPETYAEIRRGGSFDLCIKSLRKLCEAKRKYASNRPLIGIQFTINIMNVYNIHKLSLFARKYGIGLIYLSNLIPVSKKHEELACYQNEECVREFSRQIDILGRKIIDIWNVYVSRCYMIPQQTFQCPFIENRALFIRWDGKVAPCMQYSHDWEFFFDGIGRTIKRVIFGDINTESLMDIWRKDEYAQFRFRVAFGYRPSCFDCTLRDWCSYTFSNESDCYGNTPTCAHCPFARGLVSCPLLTPLRLSRAESWIWEKP